MGLVSNIVESINTIIGESFIRPWLLVLLLVLFILGLYFFMTMKLGNLSQNVEKKITYQYDYMFYLWSLYYKDHLDTLRTNPGLIIFKAVIRSGKSKYIPNKNLIQETNSKIENKLGVKVIPDEERKKLSQLFVKYNIRKYISILLKGVIILIIIFLALLLILVLWK